MNKRALVKSAIIASGSLLAASAVMADVKIGFSGPLSGPQAVVGQEQLDGFNLKVEMLGGKLGGQTATVLKEDDQVKPEIGTQIIRKYTELDKVDAMVGMGYSNVVVANLKRMAEAGIPAIVTAGGPAPLAGADCAANVFSTFAQNDGYGEAMGKLMTDKGFKNVYLMTSNYQAGKDMLAGFKRFYKGAVSGEIYTTMTQTDYSAEITQLQSTKPDALFMFYPGGLGVNFTKQLSQAGMATKLPVYSTFTVDGANLPALKDAASGIFSSNIWDSSLDNPENAAFVKAFEAKYKRTPSAYAASAYDAASILDLAVTKMKGNVSDRKAFVAAVKAAGSEFKSVRGAFKFGNNNLPIENFYVFEMVKDASGVVKTKLAATPLSNHVDAYAANCPLK